MHKKAMSALLALLALFGSACAEPDDEKAAPPRQQPPTTTSSSEPTTSSSEPATTMTTDASTTTTTLTLTVGVGTTTTTATAPPAAPTTTTTAPPTTTTTHHNTTGSAFVGSVAEIDAAVADRMTASWRPDCPVPLSDLRLLTLTHWGFDGQPHAGELVVRAGHAERIRSVFAKLFEAGFPIEQMRLVDEYGGDDDRSMAANNTSAFNCRRVAGSSRWSEHAYGTAIDINPVQNPYVRRGVVTPPAGAGFTDRSLATHGVITAGGPVVAAFSGIGWRWGGAWSSPDYQHFSASGR